MTTLGQKQIILLAVLAIGISATNAEGKDESEPASKIVRERRHAQIPDVPQPPMPPMPGFFENRVARQAPPPPPDGPPSGPPDGAPAPPSRFVRQAPPDGPPKKIEQQALLEPLVYLNDFRQKREARGRGAGHMPTKTG